MKNIALRGIIFILAVAVSIACSGPAAAPDAAQTQRIPQFENDEVKVWRSIIVPGTPLPLHRHDHPRVITALVGGTMKILEQDGSSDIHTWETGKSYWLPANAPGTMHSDVNTGDKPIEVMVVELKKAF